MTTARTPEPDPAWTAALPHRDPQDPNTAAAVARLRDAGVTPTVVLENLEDGGDRLHAAAAAPRAADWAEPFGGPLGAALIAAEVGAFAAHLVARASAVRSVAIDVLLEEYSAVAVAREIGVSRQKVYELARSRSQSFMSTLPWRRSR